MAQLSIDYGRRYRTAREALLGLLWDLSWHRHEELARAAGVRYGARLLELRRLGYVLETEELEEGKRYRLMSRERGAPQEKRVKCLLTEIDAESVVVGAPTDEARRAVSDALGSFRSNRGKQ
jgi:hypothetical protein